MALAGAYQNTPGNNSPTEGIVKRAMEIIPNKMAPDPAFRYVSVWRTAAEANNAISSGKRYFKNTRKPMTGAGEYAHPTISHIRYVT